MNYDELFEGCFIISNHNSLKQPLIGVVRNLTPASKDVVDNDRQYNIFFPELNEEKGFIRFNSGVTSAAMFLPKEEALKVLDGVMYTHDLDIQNKKISIAKIETEIAELEKRKIYIKKFLKGLIKY